MFEVVEAKREAAPVLAAFIGQSGSGKTYSALLFMRGIVGPEGRIVVIDTEGKRSLIYADDPDVGGFHHVDFVEPYSSDRFREALRVALAFGADGIIIDSASAEHEGSGGMLEFADREAERMKDNKRGNAKWIRPKMAHGRFMSAVRSCPAHVILCIREKIVIDVDVKPAVKVYLPSCDRDLPFDMGISVRLEPEAHRATFIKVPKPFLAHITDGEVVTVEHGRLLMAEAGKGDAADPAVAKMIAQLEAAADQGAEPLRHAYREAWKDAGPHATNDDVKKITPRRSKLQQHLEGLKLRAEKAERAGIDTSSSPAPGEIGDIDTRQAPDDDGDTELFRPKVAPKFPGDD